MTPIFKVIADRQDITAILKKRLISLKIVDEAGLKSDTVTIDLDDRDELISLPRHGAKLQVWLGYAQTGLESVGIYTVDEVALSGFPQTLSISGKAADMTGGIKEPQTRSFDDITLGDLVNTIATEHDLNGKTDATLAAVLYTHIDQTAESNLHLLTRLAQLHNGVAKVTHDALIIARSGASKSVSGVELMPVIIKQRMVSDYHASLTDRDKYAAVTATWHNKVTGLNVAVSTSADKPALQLRHTYDDEAAAIQAAKAKLESLTQGKSTVDITLPVGDPAVFAEAPLILYDFRPGVAGAWTITRVRHAFSNSGFSTTLTAESTLT